MSSKHSIKRKYAELFVIVTNFPGKSGDPMFLAWQNPTVAWDIEGGYFWTSEQTLIGHLQSCPDSNARPHVYAFSSEDEARRWAKHELRLKKGSYQVRSILAQKNRTKSAQTARKFALPGLSLVAWKSLCPETLAN